MSLLYDGRFAYNESKAEIFHLLCPASMCLYLIYQFLNTTDLFSTSIDSTIAKDSKR